MIKQLALPGRGSAMEKAPKGGQLLKFIGLSALMVELFGGCQLRHKPECQEEGACTSEQNEHPAL